MLTIVQILVDLLQLLLTVNGKGQRQGKILPTLAAAPPHFYMLGLRAARPDEVEYDRFETIGMAAKDLERESAGVID